MCARSRASCTSALSGAMTTARTSTSPAASRLPTATAARSGPRRRTRRSPPSSPPPSSALDKLSTTVPVQAPWEAPGAFELDGKTLEELPGSSSRRAGASRSGRRRPAADLRRRATRALTAVRAVLHRRLGGCPEPGDLSAQLRHPRRRAGGAVRRGLAAAGAEARLPALATRSCSARRSAGSSRADRGVSVVSDRLHGRRQTGDRGDPADARRAGSTTSRSCPSSATSSPSATARGR